jgi:FkbM family methyltransferase
MKSVAFLAKHAVNGLIGRWGYKIEKTVDVGDAAIDVFDLAVRQVMSETKDFFFVQIGAHNGSNDDPIRKYVTRYHWKGILVEPQEAAFRALIENYRDEPQLAFERAAIAEEDGAAQMYMPRGDERVGSVLATFDRDVLVRRVGRHAAIETFTVPTLSIRTLLRKHGIAVVDLLQIDAEGFDAQIIRMYDFAIAKPRIIRFEHINLSLRQRQESVRRLRDLGYRMAKSSIDTVAYLPVAD